MEGLKLRSFIVTGMLLTVAGWAAVSSRPVKVAGRTEAWMEHVAPAKVGEYTFAPDTDPTDNDPLCSYKDMKMVYDTLAPTVGIVARIYEAHGQKYDVTLIASRDRASFHDPRVCFSSQGFSITNDSQIMIPTKTRGTIPATLAQMDGPNGPSVAVFFYRGPHGFYGTTMTLKWALLFDQLKGRSDLDGVFYRFMPMQDMSVDHLVQFIGSYMDEAGKSSGKYF